MVEHGISGHLSIGLQSRMSFWTSVATGLPLLRHGVCPERETRPDEAGMQPTSARSWRVAPVWDVLAAQGVDTIAVGWPGSSCATHWRTNGVDDRYAEATDSLALDWPLAPSCIQPVAWRALLRDLRVHPDDLDETATRAAPPSVLAHAASMHAAATCLMEDAAWRFLAIHYGPLLAAGGVGAAMLFDAMLGRLQILAGSSCDIVVAGSGGLLAAAGPGFERDLLIHGARSADVGMTALARFGLRHAENWGSVLNGTMHGHLVVVDDDTARPLHATAGAADLPVPYETQLEIARQALADGDFGDAASQLASLLRKHPEDPELLCLSGQCQFFLGDPKETLSIGQRIVAAWPDRPWGYIVTAAGLVLSGDWTAARSPLETAVQLAEGCPRAYLLLGAIALRMGAAAEAAHYYLQALDDLSIAADAQAGLGLACMAQGDLTAAENRFRASLGLRYHAPAVHYQLGVLHASQGRTDKAIAALSTSWSQRPDVPEVAELMHRIGAPLHGSAPG